MKIIFNKLILRYPRKQGDCSVQQKVSAVFKGMFIISLIPLISPKAAISAS